MRVLGIKMILCLSLMVNSCRTVDSTMYLQENEVQLSIPITKDFNTFFKGSTVVEFYSPYEGTKVFYSLNGQSDDPIAYQKPITINSSTKLMAQTKGENFIPSESIEIELVDIQDNKVEWIETTRLPSPTYKANGPLTLSNQVKGSSNFRDGEWLGYEGGIVTFELKSKPDKEVSKVTVSVLCNQDAWIFLPHQIEVTYVDVISNKTKNHNVDIEAANQQMNHDKLIDIQLDKGLKKDIKVSIKSLPTIPEWHAGKGTPPWLFIDEILAF